MAVPASGHLLRRQPVVSPPFIPENVAGGASISPSHMVPGSLNILRGRQEEDGQQLQGRKAIRPQEDSRSSSTGSFVSETNSMTRRTGVIPLVSNHSGGLFERLIASVSDIVAILYPAAENYALF